MILKILNDKRTDKIIREFVAEIKEELKKGIIKVDLNDFYYQRLHSIVEENGIDGEDEEFSIVVDYLIWKTKDQIDFLYNITMEKALDEDDSYIIELLPEDRDVKYFGFELNLINHLEKLIPIKGDLVC